MGRVDTARLLRLVGRGTRRSSLGPQASDRRLALLVGLGATLAVLLGYLLGGGRTTESTVWPLRGSTQVDEVHLSWVGDPRTTVAIAWRSTPWAGNAALVEINHRWRELPAHASSPPPVGPDAYEDVQVSGLRPGTRYPYAIRSRAGTVSEGVLTTAPARPTPFRFDVFADQGDCTHNHAACRVIAGIAGDHPSFVLGAGDLQLRQRARPGNLGPVARPGPGLHQDCAVDAHGGQPRVPGR